MATKNDSKNTSDARSQVDKLGDEGFQKVATSVHYFKPGVSGVVVGIPLLRGTREENIDPEKPGFFYLVVLTRPCPGLVGAGKKSIDGKPGDVVHVDERHQCRVLKKYLPRERVNSSTGEMIRSNYMEVAIEATEKVPSSGGKSCWLFDIGKKEATDTALAFAMKTDLPELAAYTPDLDDEPRALPQSAGSSAQSGASAQA